MYQLSHLLSEQRSILSTLISTSIFQNQERLPMNDTETSKDEDENTKLRRKQALSDIAEKIEGCIVRCFKIFITPFLLIFHECL